MSQSLQPLLDSLEQAAEAEPNFYAAAFERYFSLCPESRELLQHSDELMRGRMMEQVVSLLMDADVESLDSYFRFEIANHEAYGAAPHMYGHLFQACKEVTQENCAGHWDAAANAAWDQQVNALLELIGRYSS